MSVAQVRAAMAGRDWRKALGLLEGLEPPDRRLSSICWTEMEEPELALKEAQFAVLADPGNPACWHQLGIAHQVAATGDSQDHYVESHACFERAFNMADTPVTASAFGSSCVTLGQYALAVSLFAHAQTQQAYPAARLAEGGALMLMKDYESGWRKMEARMGITSGTARHVFEGTIHDLRDRTLIVRAEQGFGDMIEFMRYVPRLRPYVRDVVVEVHEGLEALVAAFTGERCFAAPYIDPDNGVSVNILSLPALLGPVIGYDPIGPLSIPAQFTKPRVGIGFCPATVLGVVRDDSTYANAVVRRKRFPFCDMMRLAKDFGPFRSLLHDDLGTADFLETAHVIAGLDLVITIDTAVAHLAASLGIETWVLQRFDHCWRWDEKFYPHARIFKQRTLGDWESVSLQVHGALQARQGATVAAD